ESTQRRTLRTLPWLVALRGRTAKPGNSGKPCRLAPGVLPSSRCKFNPIVGVLQGRPVLAVLTVVHRPRNIRDLPDVGPITNARTPTATAEFRVIAADARITIWGVQRTCLATSSTAWTAACWRRGAPAARALRESSAGSRPRAPAEESNTPNTL